MSGMSRRSTRPAGEKGLSAAVSASTRFGKLVGNAVLMDGDERDVALVVQVAEALAHPRR